MSTRRSFSLPGSGLAIYPNPLISLRERVFVRSSASVGNSGDLLPPPPPAEKTTIREDQAGKAGTGDGDVLVVFTFEKSAKLCRVTSTSWEASRVRRSASCQSRPSDRS
jgi:hypothetical protein